MYHRYSKYKAKKIEYKNMIFDSKKELNRFMELELMEHAGEISDLRRQVAYTLIPKQTEPDTIGKRGGIHKGKTIEREVKYFADFVYVDNRTGETVVEDTKGMRTSDYILKRKLMLFVHNIRISEI